MALRVAEDVHRAIGRTSRHHDAYLGVRLRRSPVSFFVTKESSNPGDYPAGEYFASCKHDEVYAATAIGC
jgi:hypothetical protein